MNQTQGHTAGTGPWCNSGSHGSCSAFRHDCHWVNAALEGAWGAQTVTTSEHARNIPERFAGNWITTPHPDCQQVEDCSRMMQRCAKRRAAIPTHEQTPVHTFGIVTCTPRVEQLSHMHAYARSCRCQCIWAHTPCMHTFHTWGFVTAKLSDTLQPTSMAMQWNRYPISKPPYADGAVNPVG
jgi:hypothetical protein